jgi:hypothetical protein
MRRLDFDMKPYRETVYQAVGSMISLIDKEMKDMPALRAREVLVVNFALASAVRARVGEPPLTHSDMLHYLQAQRYFINSLWHEDWP